MILRVSWTKRSVNQFVQIQDYLESEFGLNIRNAFTKKFFVILENLQTFPELGTLEVRDKKIRGILITKHNKLFYRYNSTQLIILAFFDTRQDSSKVY